VYSGCCRPNVHAASEIGTCHRNRKKCLPQREHRQGCRIQRKDRSTTFRRPTILKSIDLQCGQCALNSTRAVSVRFYFPAFGEPVPLRRLAPRAARIRSSVPKLGCEGSAQFLSLDACRLCRFSNLFAVKLLFMSAPLSPPVSGVAPRGYETFSFVLLSPVLLRCTGSRREPASAPGRSTLANFS
jgi:hypothetical protein